MKKLLALKADFKQATGQDWKPGAALITPTSAASEATIPLQAAALDQSITQQGEKVRELKAKKASKVDFIFNASTDIFI